MDDKINSLRQAYIDMAKDCKTDEDYESVIDCLILELKIILGKSAD